MEAAAYHSETHQLLAKTEGGVWKTKNFQREIVGLLKKKSCCLNAKGLREDLTRS